MHSEGESRSGPLLCLCSNKCGKTVFQLLSVTGGAQGGVCRGRSWGGGQGAIWESGEVIQVSMGTSSSEVASSDKGISSTSSSEEEEEEEEEKDGEAERGMELVEDEEEGEALKRKMVKPSV